MLKRQTLHKSRISQLNETVFSAQKNVNKLSNVASQITPNATVQVDMKFYRLATNIFQVLHSKDGKRVDSNIWSFPNYESAYEFVDSLMLLGIDEKYITYPASFLLYGKENQDNSTDEEIEDELDTLEGSEFENSEFGGEDELEDIGEDEEIDLYGEDEFEEVPEQEPIEGEVEEVEEAPAAEHLEDEFEESPAELEDEEGELDILELEQDLDEVSTSTEEDELEELEKSLEEDEGSEEDSELQDLLNRLEKEA